MDGKVRHSELVSTGLTCFVRIISRCPVAAAGSGWPA
jgi:hypothetical protein